MQLTQIKSPISTKQIMFEVMLALMPGMLVLIYNFGSVILLRFSAALAIACLVEGLVLRIRKLPIKTTLSDGSAMLTGLLLVICLPPNSTFSLIAIGVSSALVLGKHVYGGLGQNLFNPAMVGYVILLISFPAAMSDWGSSINEWHGILIDSVSGATPLDSFRTAQRLHQTYLHPNTQWIYLNLAWGMGGIYLILRRIISWHIPFSLCAGVLVTASLVAIMNHQNTYPLLAHYETGAAVFTAFFIATDPVTGSATRIGQLVFGFSIGVLAILIRSYSHYPDGFAFAVLLMNSCVPSIDYLTQRQH